MTWAQTIDLFRDHWVLALQWLSILLSGVAIVGNFVLFLRLQRHLYRAMLLDRLLTKLCVDAFTSRQLPVWAAWCATMGSIDVTMEVRRRDPETSDTPGPNAE